MIGPVIKRIIAPAGRGSVMIIAALLISSASLRLVTSASSALAQDSQLPTAPFPAAVPEATTATDKTIIKTTEKADTSPISKMDRSEMSGLINALTERELHVAKREKKLEMRLRALSIADAEIEKRLLQLTETEQKLRSTLSLADEASENDLLRLTAVYESMKPKNTAALFEEMEPNFSAGFLARMRPDVAAQVMAGLSPQVAYSISVILAGRNASAPKT